MPGLSHPSCDTSPLVPDIQEQNVAFVVYASASQPSKLCNLKELLIKTLFSLASKPTDCMFSIVICAKEVLTWQHGLVKCSLTSVAEAAAWIRTFLCESGATAWSAVAAALKDPICQAVYLFTTGLPECVTEEICSYLRETRQACQVHTVFLIGNGAEDENSSQEILEKFAKESGGSLQVISLKSDKASDEDNPSYTADHHSDCTSKHHHSSLLTGHHTTTYFPLGACNPDSPNTFLRGSVKEGIVGWFPKIHDFQRGIRVLARRETNGYYYLGHIVQEVKGSREHVLIEFERSQRSPKGKVQLRMQETPLYDIIHYEDARWQPLVQGDKILAPWENKGERYGPGIVLQVAETGSPHSVFKNSEVLVNFWNGQTKKVSADVAVKIPPPLCERITLELQMSLAARQMLVEQNPDYPSVVPPGYRASGPCKQNHFGQIHWHGTPKAPCAGSSCSSPHLSICHFCIPAWEPIVSWACTIQPDDALIPGTNVTMEELNRKVEEQLSKGGLSRSRGNKKEESSKPREESNFANLEYCEDAENIITKPNKDHERKRASENPKERTGTMVDVAVNTDKCTVTLPHRKVHPSQRSLSRKTRAADTSQLQTMFDQVDQSLKKDHSAIQSVLHVRRSYSAPSMQRSAVKELPQDYSRQTDIDTARIAFKRQKWEQRRLKGEQKQMEEHMKKELLFDKKRQRSLQRTLQDSQKQQENSNRAGQHMKQLQTARAERKQQELCLQDEERSKESQRLEFLKTQHKQREKWLTEHSQRTNDHEKKRLELLRNRMRSTQQNLEVARKEEDTQKKEKEAAKCQVSQERIQLSQQAELKSQKHQDLQQYLRDQSLLALRASLLF